MAGSPETAHILDQLRATRTSAKERQNAMERNIRCAGRRVAPIGREQAKQARTQARPMLSLLQNAHAISAAAAAAAVRREEARKLRQGESGATAVRAEPTTIGGVSAQVAARQVCGSEGWNVRCQVALSSTVYPC